MKLFIVNKIAFDNHYQSFETQKKIHQKAYNRLMLKIAYDDTIPYTIEVSTDVDIAQFKFLSRKGDIYFFEFNHI